MTLYKELRPLLCTQHGGRTARQLENREEAGVVAAPRTDAQRTAVRDDCAERPGGRVCGMAVQTERPIGIDWLAAYRLTLSERDSSD